MSFGRGDAGGRGGHLKSFPRTTNGRTKKADGWDSGSEFSFVPASHDEVINGSFIRAYRWNWGHGRFLPFEPAIHESVDTRKKLCKGYTPAATQKPGHEGSEYYVQ